MKLGLRFRHHGLAVRRDDVAVKFLSALGYDVGEMVHDAAQGVNLRLCVCSGMPDVELIMPAGKQSPLDPIFKSHDELIYHTCYEVDDAAMALRSMEEMGFRVMELVPPKPAVLFGGRTVSFHKVFGYGIIELLRSSQK